MNAQTDYQHGADVIREKARSLPAKPGVYRMMAQDETILYVGKAKHLPNRLLNYTNLSGLTTRIMRMVSQVHKVDITMTQSEAEALLLEASLIKQHSPRYNILLKDDKSFPFIAFTADHEFPRIKKHRGEKKGKDQYFGPFASAGAVNEAITTIQKAFLLRGCSDHIFKNRNRPCLEYQIKRCTAPCVGYVNEKEYAGQVQMAANFLRGKSREIQDDLAKQMQAASADMEYERAGALRDRIRALSKLQSSAQFNLTGVENADIIALARKGAHSVVGVHIIRSGQHFGHQMLHPKHDGQASESAILTAFLGQFYDKHLPPQEVYLSHGIEENEAFESALSLRAKSKVHIHVPKRGEKKAAMGHALENAGATLKLELQAGENIATQHEAFAKLLGMKTPIRRIEVFDNSHVMGTYAVGGMIVATESGFDKASYRIFRFQDAGITAGDDYGMMRHMLTRRLQRIKQAQEALARHTQMPGEEWHDESIPDVLLIDGGKGQLSIALDVRKEVGAEVAILAIAKGENRNAGREWFHLPGQTPFQLPPNDALLHYLQRLRDEAHRFAITNHRRRRAKAISKSALDDIPGIGAVRKRALMHHFGARAGVEAASVSELMQVDGISAKIAQGIYDYFHGE